MSSPTRFYAAPVGVDPQVMAAIAPTELQYPQAQFNNSSSNINQSYNAPRELSAMDVQASLQFLMSGMNQILQRLEALESYVRLQSLSASTSAGLLDDTTDAEEDIEANNPYFGTPDMDLTVTFSGITGQSCGTTFTSVATASTAPSHYGRPPLTSNRLNLSTASIRLAISQVDGWEIRHPSLFTDVIRQKKGTKDGDLLKLPLTVTKKLGFRRGVTICSRCGYSNDNQHFRRNHKCKTHHLDRYDE